MKKNNNNIVVNFDLQPVILGKNRNIAMRYRKKKTIIIEIINKNIKFVVLVNFDLLPVIL